MWDLRQIFTVLLAVACMAGGGCRYFKSESNYVEYFELTSTDVPPDGKTKALAVLHSWAVGHGYTRLVAPADVVAATGHGASPHEEVWRKTLDPRVPKSNFVVITIEDEKTNLFMIELKSERWGDDSDHKRQIPMVEKEREEFYKAFADFPWLKRDEAR